MSSKRATARRFDRWASKYEKDRRSRFNAGPQREALAALRLGPEDRFLDLGCGTGAAVRAAAPLVEQAVGVDLAPKMIERAGQLAGDVERVAFAVGDSEHLPFEGGAFTAALCTSSFHHYPDPATALREVARVLSPTGRLVIGDGTGDLSVARMADRLLRLFDRSHVRLYRTEELVWLLEQAGFVETGRKILWDGGFVILSAGRAPLNTSG
jgi:ubiquinone/menaquinone biosynthesis C-methylase UbiE